MAARSPFQGTFNPNARPTVTMAPDALVYINGETEVIGCGSCRRKFDINKFVTSITVDLNIDSPPGSASITLNVPRHAIDDVYFEGVPVITPMMEIEIFAKGFFLVDGVPQYYPIFWGLITEVTDQYSSGTHTLSINCADILKWWELCRININAAYTQTNAAAFGWSVYGNVFSGRNPFDVIWLLAQQSVGDVVLGTGSLNNYKAENKDKPVFKTFMQDMILYWQDRFSRVKSNLLLFGAEGVAVRGSDLESVPVGQRAQTFASKAVQTANGGPSSGGLLFDPTDRTTVAYKKNWVDPGNVNLWQSEYETKLDIANKAKDTIGYEFYMDVTGDIIFKPPFFNLDVIDNKPLSWIQDIDIIDWDFSESESEVVTQVQMSGSFTGGVDVGVPQDIETFASVTDWHLLRKYGWRVQPINSEFMRNAKLLFYYGLDTMDRLNSRRHRGTISIPLRPELRLGFPIYVEPKDQIWYVSGISHSISFGSSAQTTLTLTSRRSKFFAPRGIGKLKLNNVNMAKVSKKNANGATTPQAVVAAEKVVTDRDQKGDVFKYTVRELSQGGEFTIETSGDMASIPATDINVFDNTDPDKNPYSPLILRHPRTGRTCGFPNVVLTYTRPFTFPPEVTSRVAGASTPEQRQKRAAQGTAARGGSSTTANSARPNVVEENFDLKFDTDPNTDDNKVRIKYMQNRYLYGLNSAGVFMYLYDEGDKNGKPVISETLIIPKSSVKWPQNTDKAQEKESNIIRPISDERGFEVIGHFRYGRGLKLRDGSLIRSTESNTNTRSSIDYQVTPYGSLVDGLTVSETGVRLPGGTTLPADALSKMKPNENETAAGLINSVDATHAEVIFDLKGSKDRFISTFPAAYKNAAAVPLSVEVTQLSKALTLAQMTALYGTGSQASCGCAMARRDLAFMYVQPKAPAGSTVEFELFDQNNNGIPLIPVGKPGDVAKKVNDYLWKLYDDLDQAHQDHEKKLRGEREAKVENPWEQPTPAPAQPAPAPVQQPAPPPAPAVPAAPVAAPTLPPGSTLAPPYSIPELLNTRGMSWDALVASAEGNWEAILNSWDQMTDQMYRETVVRYYEGRITILSNELASLQRRLAQMNANESTSLTFEDDRRTLLEAIQRVESELEGERLNLANVRNGGSISDADRARVLGG